MIHSSYSRWLSIQKHCRVGWRRPPQNRQAAWPCYFCFHGLISPLAGHSYGELNDIPEPRRVRAARAARRRSDAGAGKENAHRSRKLCLPVEPRACHQPRSPKARNLYSLCTFRPGSFLYPVVFVLRPCFRKPRLREVTILTPLRRTASSNFSSFYVNIHCYDSCEVKKLRSIPRRRPKKEKPPSKLVVYLSEEESELVERAASAVGRSKSAFGADVVIAEANRILSKHPRT